MLLLRLSLAPKTGLLPLLFLATLLGTQASRAQGSNEQPPVSSERARDQPPAGPRDAVEESRSTDGEKAVDDASSPPREPPAPESTLDTPPDEAASPATPDEGATVDDPTSPEPSADSLEPGATQGDVPRRGSQADLEGGAPAGSASGSEPDDETTSDQQLVPRLGGNSEAEEKSALSSAPGPISPRPKRSEPPGLDPQLGPPDRHVELPARVVQRPLSLPRGTMLFGFSLEAIFLDHASTSARMPFFAWGITEDVELGLSAGLRYDQSLAEWTALDPTPTLLVTVFDREQFELGVQGKVVIPLSSEARTQAGLSVPLRFHTSERLRVDVIPAFELGFDDPVEARIDLGLRATYQHSNALYLGVSATPTIGLTARRSSGSDASLFVGTTLGSRDRARADLEGEFFYEGLGAGPPDHYSQGGGLIVQLRFFPELY